MIGAVAAWRGWTPTWANAALADNIRMTNKPKLAAVTLQMLAIAPDFKLTFLCRWDRLAFRPKHGPGRVG